MINFPYSLSYGLVITFLHPEGYETTSRASVPRAIAVYKKLLYPLPRATTLPASSMIPTKVDRNREIYERYMAGERALHLADEFGISVRRVNKLINRFRRSAL